MKFDFRQILYTEYKGPEGVQKIITTIVRSRCRGVGGSHITTTIRSRCRGRRRVSQYQDLTSCSKHPCVCRIPTAQYWSKRSQRMSSARPRAPPEGHATGAKQPVRSPMNRNLDWELRHWTLRTICRLKRHLVPSKSKKLPSCMASQSLLRASPTEAVNKRPA
jgi:hypothetical protein